MNIKVNNAIFVYKGETSIVDMLDGVTWFNSHGWWYSDTKGWTTDDSKSYVCCSKSILTLPSGASQLQVNILSDSSSRVSLYIVDSDGNILYQTPASSSGTTPLSDTIDLSSYSGAYGIYVTLDSKNLPSTATTNEEIAAYLIETLGQYVKCVVG